MPSQVLQRVVTLVLGISIGIAIALSGFTDLNAPSNASTLAPSSPAPSITPAASDAACTVAPSTVAPSPVLAVPLSMTSTQHEPLRTLVGSNGCPLGMNTDDMLGIAEHTTKKILVDVPATVTARRTRFRNRRQKIPYRIMQNNKLDQVPLGMWHAMHSVVAHNPEYDYEYFSDERMRSFIVVNMNRRTLEAFDTLVPGAFKSDLFRYCWLWVRGGIYVDSDMTAFEPLSKLLPPDAEFVSPEDNNNGFLYNAFLATTPHHPIIGAAITLSVDRILAHWYGHVLAITGPVLLGEAFESIVQHRPKKLTSYLNGTIRINNYERRGDCGAGFVNDESISAFVTAYPTYRAEMSWYHAGTKQYWDYVYSRTAYVDHTKLIDSCPFGLRVGAITEGVVPPFNGLELITSLVDVSTLIPATNRSLRTSRRIPYRLMFAAPVSQITVGMRENINDVIDLARDHDIEFYSVHTARDYMRLHCPDLVDVFDGLRPVLMQLDVFRYCWLYTSGGLALSPYSTFFVNFSFVGEQDTFVVARDAAVDLPSDTLLGAAPRHPVMKRALDLVAQRVRQQEYGSEFGHVVGRNLLKDALDSNPGLDNIHLLKFIKADHCIAGVVRDANDRAILFNSYVLARSELSWYLPVPTPKDAFAARTVFVNQTKLA